jgi:exodeoxyribonuclease VII large subunit
MQPSLFSVQQWTVTRLTFYIRNLLETDVTLQDLWVSGEVSNLSRPASGHIYFTLKDTNASLRCIMWKTSAARLGLTLKDGMAVEVHGKIGVYDAGGQYQLYADQIRPTGEGVLYQEFMRLKAMLEAEGLFDPERKRAIPEGPRLIGIITSSTGAALRDMLTAIRRRNPLMEVLLAPAPVQGDEAPPKIVAALEALNRRKPDVILLARGGGSIEDLWAFNDERVVRAVANSIAPVINGVGHETDFTLCDFAADLRAPTPTAAAELATQITIDDLRVELENYQTRFSSSTFNLVTVQQTFLASLSARLRFVSPERRIQSDIQYLDDLSRRELTSIVYRLQLQKKHIEGTQQRLDALNPLAVLRRGYAVVTRKDDSRVITHVSQTADEMRVRVSDGEFEVRKKT